MNTLKMLFLILILKCEFLSNTLVFHKMFDYDKVKNEPEKYLGCEKSKGRLGSRINQRSMAAIHKFL